LPFETFKFAGDLQFAYCGKEYPTEDLAGPKGVSPIICEKFDVRVSAVNMYEEVRMVG